jgi:hypothetical protein
VKQTLPTKPGDDRHNPFSMRFGDCGEPEKRSAATLCIDGG